MSNNRMFLLHRPTGLAVMLAKRMGYGWYLGASDAPGRAFERLFEVLETEYDYGGNQDDFCIAMEDAEGATLADGDWTYSPEPPKDGIILLIRNIKP